MSPESGSPGGSRVVTPPGARSPARRADCPRARRVTELQAGETLRGRGRGEPAAPRAVSDRLDRLWHASPAAGTPTGTGLTDPVICDRFAPVTAPCTRGVCPLTSAMPGSADTPPRTRQLDRAMMFETGHNRRRSTTHGPPALSVARTLTVSLHPVARPSLPLTQPSEPRAIHPTNHPPTLDACCSNQHGGHRCHARLDAKQRITTLAERFGARGSRHTLHGAGRLPPSRCTRTSDSRH